MRMVKRIVDIFLLLLILGLGACLLVPDFSSVIEARATLPLKELMTGIFGAFALPIFEILVVAIPVLLIIMLARGYVSGVTTVAKLLLATYILTLGIPSKLPTKLSVPKEPTAEEYATVASLLCDRLGEAPPPEDYTLTAAATAATNYARESLGIDFTEAPKIKQSIAPAVLTEMGIVAYFAFATAEVVVNTAAPDFMTVFATAHETLHLLGITREDEASFHATLALIASGDTALLTTAYLSAFVYVGARLCTLNFDTYSEIYDHLPDFARQMLDLRTEFLGQKGNTLGKVSDTLNDAAIGLRDSRGADSYSGTAALLVSYFL